MKILVIGSGGREHAIVDALRQSPDAAKIYAAPGNGGIREQAECVPIASDDISSLIEFARESRIDLTFVGPEVPLSMGVVDIFRKDGLTIVGPTSSLARLESSKTFAKQFFKANNIPTADFWECSSPREAYDVLNDVEYPTVIKADGLAAGKGVTIAENRDQARAAIAQVMEAKTLGEAGTRVVIEKFMEGEEASFHVFADGTSFQPMVSSQDHKRRFDDDKGPNTGGMGAYSVDSILSKADYDAVINRIVRPTLEAAKTYSGILYVGLMLTSEGPKVVEYNVRFGDPETQVILPRLKTSLLDVLVDLAEHRLAARQMEWRPDVTATVVLVAGGYPGKYETGKRIVGLDEVRRIEGVKVFHAGTRWEDGSVYTSGGRVLNVTARGVTLTEALQRAYFAAQMIDFEGKDYRTDIGRKGLARTR
jgi:phosphoribosylamine--glycine ligase